MHLTSRNPQLARRNNKAWNTLPSWRSLRPRSSTKWRNLKIFLKQYLGTTPLFIPYVSYWGVRSYSTNQPALHSFNYHLRASLAWSEGREEGGKYRGDLQDFSQSSPYNCVVIMISKSALQIPLWSDIFRLKSVGEAWGEVRVTASDKVIQPISKQHRLLSVCRFSLSRLSRPLPTDDMVSRLT